MTDNIHGRCVWDCEHTVVDHQSVLMNFADGATATLNMIGGTAKPERNIHIIGTKGEIKGVFDDSVFTVRTIDTASEKGWNEEVVDLKIGGDKSGMTGSHGGGDLRLGGGRLFMCFRVRSLPSPAQRSKIRSMGIWGSSAQSVLARRAPS